MMTKASLRVLIVDDAVVFRRGISEMLSDVPYIEVVGTAANGKIALMKIPSLKPDAMILDVEMPEMDGIETLKALRELHPSIKVIMLSIHTTRGAEKTLEALSLGAIDFVEKPSGSNDYRTHFQTIRGDLLPKLRLLKLQQSFQLPEKRQVPPKQRTTSIRHQDCEIIAIASSTGGPNALNVILPDIVTNANVGILIVQHMPPLFTKQFALSLDQKLTYTVCEASTGDAVSANTIFIAPGNYHMIVRQVGKDHRIALHQGPLENGCRPSADVLFRSVAEIYGKKALGIVLTGMGKDGLEGVKAMKAREATIIAQDKDTSIAWGMPRSVVEAELADYVLPLQEIAQAVNTIVS
ncbi:chemotaxis response regulator protein-glutamate methylesterase 1 [Candidatus Vecturithrix granuli]|uniref:Protein-glutamate methylesterase/protein-glutamine glutaminase n=1 Tax=Vecturithrix granuli TaxID=1499967 RepID=A0A081C3E8_VECG1|nr:chemotaxis response regulator protein-glutamate methylesterase 1 [Candidatus Vecturithrix granuli]